jgi:hypothetical protein
MTETKTKTDKAPEKAPAKAPATAKKVKRKVQTPTDALAAIGTVRSAVLQQSIAVARKEFSDKNICAAGDANKIVIGLPLPSLALEFLIQNTVWPLGRFTQIVGKHGTCKSALTFEMMRWFKNAMGLAYLFENETKYSPDLALSIIGYPESSEDEILAHIPCDSVDDWQSKLQTMVKWCKEQMLKKEIGKKFPVLFVVDSLMGKLARESQEKIEKTGYADRSHPLEAMMINSFLKKIPQDIEEWPMCLVATNHLKPQKSEHGPQMERKIAGGAAPGFQETFEIEMSRDASAKINQVDEGNFEVGGLKLILACKKNSLGETDRKIKASIKWVHREDEATGDFRQYTEWDWPTATVNLLTSYEGHRKERIDEVVHIGGSGNKLYSKTYGIPSSDPVDPHTLGELIEADEEAKAKLRKLFGIKTRKVYQPGVDYHHQLAAIIQAAEKQMTK